jgi:hypothetical protein
MDECGVAMHHEGTSEQVVEGKAAPCFERDELLSA